MLGRAGVTGFKRVAAVREVGGRWSVGYLGAGCPTLFWLWHVAQVSFTGEFCHHGSRQSIKLSTQQTYSTLTPLPGLSFKDVTAPQRRAYECQLLLSKQVTCDKADLSWRTRETLGRWLKAREETYDPSIRVGDGTEC